MRALTHIGLAVAIVLVPAFCCCKVRGLGGVAHAAPVQKPVSTSLPEGPPTAPVESCCAKAKTSCCHIPLETPKPAPTPAKQENSTPVKPTAPAESCACCGERLDAAQTESKPTVAPAEATGELLPLAVDALAGSLEHTSWFHGTHPPGHAGVDARSAALFERHVLRC